MKRGADERNDSEEGYSSGPEEDRRTFVVLGHLFTGQPSVIDMSDLSRFSVVQFTESEMDNVSINLYVDTEIICTEDQEFLWDDMNATLDEIATNEGGNEKENEEENKESYEQGINPNDSSGTISEQSQLVEPEGAGRSQEKKNVPENKPKDN